MSDVQVLPNTIGARTIGRPQPVPPSDTDGFWLFIGRLRIRKAVEVLLEAVKRLGAEGESKVPLWIVGDGEQRRSLEETVRRLGLAHRVRFLGRRNSAEVRDLLSRARALVVPSTYEGMPLVILEAMESGVPVVASAVSGIPEVVQDKVTGWLVPAEDADALARALAETLDKTECRRRGEAGRQRLEDRFRPAEAVRLWHSLLMRYPTGGVERGKTE